MYYSWQWMLKHWMQSWGVGIFQPFCNNWVYTFCNQGYEHVTKILSWFAEIPNFIAEGQFFIFSIFSQKHFSLYKSQRSMRVIKKNSH